MRLQKIPYEVSAYRERETYEASYNPLKQPRRKHLTPTLRQCAIVARRHAQKILDEISSSDDR